MRFLRGLPLSLLVAAACSSDPPPPADSGAPGDVAPDAPAPRNVLETVAETGRWEMPGLEGEAEVLITEAGVPHVYARSERDLARVHGFVVARDRFFFMDMARRQALGIVSGLLGDNGLRTDMQSRGAGITHVAELILANLTEEQGRFVDAFAEGVNHYIEMVRAGRAPPPSEFGLLAPLTGRRPADIMTPFARRDMAALLATIVYNLGYETGDVERAAAFDRLPGNFTGVALAELRRAGALADVWNRLAPLRPTTSAAGFGVETASGASALAPGGRDDGEDRARPPARDPAATLRALRVPRATVDGLVAQLDEIRVRHRRVEGFGSNSWAVMGRGARDGRALLAGDGHLPLSVPALFYQIGLDTQVLGGGDVHQMGLVIPGVPLLAVGTNGRVAWCQTQLGGDITDWYREELVLDASGNPTGTRFQGMVRPVMRFEERFDVASVPALMSVGRTETWTRLTTFDGRWITAIEGRRVMPGEAPRPGETRVMTLADVVVPGDTDGDGVVTAVSFDYAAFDGGNLLQALRGFGRANNVREFQQATRGLVAYSQNLIAADAQGSVLYSSYQAVPCRAYLPRGTSGGWAPGADPSRLLDGTRYGGFRIPIRDGIVDERAGASDPYACVVPFERTPQALDPARGYVLTANNDPGNISLDDDLANGAYYVGGPWGDGYRAHRIDELLRESVMNRGADTERMAQIQADVKSPLGGQLVPVLLDAIAQARTASTGTPPAGSAEARLAAQYRASQRDYDEVARRLGAWRDRGYFARSGVETFYHTPAAGDREDAVATSIFNAWMGRFVGLVLDDEPFSAGIYANGGGVSRMRTLVLMLDGRGENATRLASHNPATRESAYFDVLGTEPVETSREVALTALDRALAFLRAAPMRAGQGGFGTGDMDAWLWGLRHHTRFEFILASVLGSDPSLSFLSDRFSITPTTLPLAPMLAAGDPRRDLPGFPRPGDHWNVDAANSGTNGERFSYGSGPNFRMVIALGPNSTTGQNVLPGGQSGITTSPHFADQARLWLGNRTIPMHLAATDVAMHATGREHFAPRR